MDNIQQHQKELCNKLWSMAIAPIAISSSRVVGVPSASV